MKNQLPEYINCKSITITHCDFYIHNDCPETCNYAWDIKGQGCGAMDIGLVKKLKEEWEFDPDSGIAHKK